jgi:tight adherence protein C
VTTLVLSTLALLAGFLLLAVHVLIGRRAPLVVRLGRAEGIAEPLLERWSAVAVPDWLARLRRGYERELRRAGGDKTLRKLAHEKLLLAFAAPFVVLAPYAGATGRAPTPIVVLVLAAAGSFVPDLLLRQEAKRRRESIFLDLPDAISVLALSLGAGQSLRQALELAGRDCKGPLAVDLERALSLARRERGLSEREALVRVARESGEPTFARFAELLAIKESPYLDFLRQQAREARAEQARYLERAADRAYLAMHAPLAPLLAVTVLLLAYGFLRFLAHTV